MQKMGTMGLAVLVLGATLTVVAVAEDVTVSTYYPSPKGMYQQLSTTGQTVLATQGGNVGIGTTTPGVTLDINGALRTSGATTLRATTVNGALTVSAGNNATMNGNLTVTGATQLGTVNAAGTTVTTLNTSGTATVNSFRMGGATTGFVLKATNNSGDAAWQAPTAVYQ